jgi:hypothetical protein
MEKQTPKIFRRFILSRHEDECGVSGTGLVAEGIEFSSGRCVICWLSHTASIAIYESISDVEKVHGHGGKTVIEWLDNT